MQSKAADKIYYPLRKIYSVLDKADVKLSGNKKVQYLLLFLSVVLFGVAIFILNLKTPYQWDDFRLSQIWPNEDGLKVQNFRDILTSQYNHYYTWGGRTIVHIVAQYLVFIEPLKADILNTMAYLAYVLLIYWHIKGKGNHDVIVFAGVNFLVYFLQPVFGETILWLTGSANYLWGTVFILLFILPYRMYGGEKSKYAVLKCLPMLILGIAAGWTNENTAAAMIVMLLLFIVLYKSRKWKIPAWAITGLIGAAAGYFIMIIAPGNVMRADLRTDGMSFGLFELTYRILTSTELLFQYLGIINLLAFILLVLYKQYSKSTKNYDYTVFLVTIYFIGTLVSVYVMLFSPFFPPRAWFGAVTFNIIVFGIVFNELDLRLDFLRKIRIASFLIGAALFAFTYYEAVRDVIYIDNIWKERHVAAEKQIETGEKATLYFTQSRTKFALSDPPFLKKCFRWYYGIDVNVK